VSVDGAGWLIARGVRLVGTDFISIETADDPTFPVHRALLGAGIAIVEGLDLRNASTGEYTLWCLPLKIHEGDGAPARVVLVEE
jgi:arylformamidase